MGTVIKRIALIGIIATLAAPGLASAEPAWYHPGAPYRVGPAGGDSEATMVEADPATGELRAVQYQVAGVSGSLGCVGEGPYVMFDVTHDAGETAIDQVTVTYDPAIVSPYTFMKLSVLHGDTSVDPEAPYEFVDTIDVRGPILGAGELTLELPEAVSGVLTARFGLEVTSNCPGLDGGQVTFTGVGFGS